MSDRRLGIKAGLFCLLALGVALVGNALHPRGLELGRDYFPELRAAAAGGEGVPEHPYEVITTEEAVEVLGGAG